MFPNTLSRGWEHVVPSVWNGRGASWNTWSILFCLKYVYPFQFYHHFSLTYINTWHTYICLFKAFKNKDKSTKNRRLMSQAMQTQHFTWNAAFIKRLLNRLIACKPKLCRVVSGYPWGSAVIKPALQAHEKYGNARRKVPLPYGQQHRFYGALRRIGLSREKLKRRRGNRRCTAFWSLPLSLFSPFLPPLNKPDTLLS